MRLFSGSDVVRAVGMNQKVLTQWIDRGLIIPAKKAAGSGDKCGVDSVVSSALLCCVIKQKLRMRSHKRTDQ